MPDIKQLLNDEIRRLARKEIKLAVAPLLENIAALKKTVAEQRRQIVALDRMVNAAAAPAATPDAAEAGAETEAPRVKVRVSPAGIAKLRKKLDLSRILFARLINASPLSVANWEAGKTSPRQEYRERIAALRTIGKRELARRLAETAETAENAETPVEAAEANE